MFVTKFRSFLEPRKIPGYSSCSVPICSGNYARGPGAFQERSEAWRMGTKCSGISRPTYSLLASGLRSLTLTTRSRSFARGSHGVCFRTVLGIIFTKLLTEAPSGHTYALAKMCPEGRRFRLLTACVLRCSSKTQPQVRNRSNVATGCKGRLRGHLLRVSYTTRGSWQKGLVHPFNIPESR